MAISGLNFLGLGVQPPWPEWGAMLNEGRPFLFSAARLISVQASPSASW
jgi:peptide/nickel transport system permease protein